jgi:DNA methylase
MYQVDLGNGLDKLSEYPNKVFDLVFAGLWDKLSRDDMATIVEHAGRTARNAIVLQPVTDSHACRLACLFEDAGYSPRLETGIKIQNTLTVNAPLRSTQQMVVVPMPGAPTSSRNELELPFGRPYAGHTDRIGARTGNTITANLSSKHRNNADGTRRLRTFFPMPVPRKSKTRDQPSQSITVAARFIAEWTQPGDIVLDFSCGSGTTGEAALRLYRKFVGIDIEPSKVTMTRNLLETIRPKPLKHELAELNRQIVHDYSRVRRWAPEAI